MTIAPTLITARLTLRHQKIEDFGPLGAVLQSDRAAYMGGPFDLKTIWHWLASEAGSWSLQGHGSWAVELNEAQECIGQVGLNKPPRFPELELGWMMCEGYEGKGLAYEAARRAKKFAFDSLKLTTLVSYIDSDNSRSIALAKRLGAFLDENAAGEDDTDLVYRHPAPQVLQ